VAAWQSRGAFVDRRTSPSNEIERSLPPPVVHLTVATLDVHRSGGRVALRRAKAPLPDGDCSEQVLIGCGADKAPCIEEIRLRRWLATPLL
jgi:hypothetical protein